MMMLSGKMVIMAPKGRLYVASGSNNWVKLREFAMRFVSEGVCVIRYCGPMRYALHFPANQAGGHQAMRYKGLCVFRGIRYEGFDCNWDAYRRQ
jgi:hypothetical protein